MKDKLTIGQFEPDLSDSGVVVRMPFLLSGNVVRYAAVLITHSAILTEELIDLELRQGLAQVRQEIIEDFLRSEVRAVYKDEFQEKVFIGKCNGVIANAAKGDFGFGYDPLFFVPELNKTFAQLTIEEKAKISHRGMAIKGLKKFLKKA